MKSPQYVIGIDGGGTKTAAIIADLKGNILAQHAAGPSNFQIIGIDKAAKTIFSLIRNCCRSVRSSEKDIRALTIGLTGAGRPNDQKRMADGLRKFALSQKVRFKKLQIESDARIALEGAFRGEAGIILIAGTGSIAFGKDEKGNVYRVGGWGRILGDEGSGFFIGRLALTAVCRHLDTRSAPTLLTPMIGKKFGLKTSSDIITAAYKDHFDIAKIAPLVFDAAEKEDPASVEIVQLASLALAEHVSALLTKIQSAGDGGKKKKIPLSFIGGLIANNTPLQRILYQQVLQSLPDVNIIPPMAPPVFGAVVMALS